jgi:tetratricopeptide (TPR) repeat protein
MAPPPLAIKLRCASWEQLARMHERDLSRGMLFLKSQKPPPLGTVIRIDLTIPSGSTIAIDTHVARHVPGGERGAGVELSTRLPASDMWIIESALVSAGFQVRPASAGIVRARPAKPPTEIPTEVGEAVEEPDAAAAELELVHALEAELASLRAMNPFQVLGLSYDADDQTVRAAFNELTKKYHPDRFARYESETARGLAGEIFILVREAYRRLGDVGARAAAQAAMAGKPAPPRAAPVAARATPPAGVPAVQPQRVISFANPAGRAPTPPQVARPIDLLSMDTLFDGVEEPGAAGATPVTALGAASPFVARGEQLLDSGRYDEAWQAFDAAARSHPGDRPARVGRELARGFQRLGEGDRMAAAQCFEAALEIDPMNERAARELAAMRRAATDARRGLLGKLLGKKS